MKILNGINGINGTVHQGENNIYNSISIPEGETIVNIQAIYDPVEGDNISPPIYAILSQKVTKTNGAITLGEILECEINGTGPDGAELSEDVHLELMTNGSQLSACYDSDATRTYSGWVFQQIEVP